MNFRTLQRQAIDTSPLLGEVLLNARKVHSIADSLPIDLVVFGRVILLL